MTDFQPIEIIYGTTPKKAEKAIEAARTAAIKDILARHLPGVTLKWWAGREQINFMPTIERMYFSSAVGDLGFIELRLTRRQPNGSYEQHRWTKGEDQTTETWRSTLPPEVDAAFRAAFAEYCTRTGQEWKVTATDYFHFTDLLPRGQKMVSAE